MSWLCDTVYVGILNSAANHQSRDLIPSPAQMLLIYLVVTYINDLYTLSSIAISIQQPTLGVL